MKKLLLNIAVLAAALTGAMSASAQETETKSTCETQTHVGLEIKSSEIRRGLQIGSGPAFKPSFAIQAGGFSIGAEGTMCTGEDLGFESNLFMKYRFPFDLTLEVTDYYRGGNWLGVNFDNIAKTHKIEPAIRYQYDKLQFYAAFMFSEDYNMDFYGEVSYDFDLFKLAIGGGNGMYTTSPVWNNGGDFGMCNISVSKAYNIQVTDKFVLPIEGGVALNPSIERMYAFASVKLGK